MSGQLPFSESEAAKPQGVVFRIDWFAFTVHQTTRTFVVEVMRAVLGDEWKLWDVLYHGDRKERSKGPQGSLMEVNWKEKWVHVQIKGKGCGVIGVEAIMGLHDALHARAGHASRPRRVDLTWDDFEKRITPSLIREKFWDPSSGAKRPSVVCKAKSGHWRQDDEVGGGCSYTIGKRLSKRMLRVYDKAAESSGEVDAMRVELECKEDVAEVAIRVVAAAAGNRSAAALRFLVGFLDFREISDGARSRKGTRAEWWSAFVGDAGKAKLAPAVREGLEQWRRAFVKQNASGYRLLLRLNYGDLGMTGEELIRGNLKDNPRHAAWHKEILWQRTGRTQEDRDREEESA